MVKIFNYSALRFTFSFQSFQKTSSTMVIFFPARISDKTGVSVITAFNQSCKKSCQMRDIMHTFTLLLLFMEVIS
jgi:hypothetical protein